MKNLPQFIEKLEQEPFLAEFYSMNEAGDYQEAFVSMTHCSAMTHGLILGRNDEMENGEIWSRYAQSLGL